MNIRDVLNHQLNKPSHIVKVVDKANDLRLVKNSRLMRYAYSLKDIENEFSSIENFLNQLINKGFQQATFTFQRTYGTSEKATYHTMKELTVNLNDEVQSQPTHTSLLQEKVPQAEKSPAPNFLAGMNGMAMPNMQFLGAMVQSERANDYLKRVNELEETVRDYKSEIRKLQEENHSLKLKVETSEERAELKVQTELLNKKGVLESDGFQKLAEGLGGIIPHIVPAILNKGNAPAQLGAPNQNLSPIQQQAIELIKQSDEQTASFIVYVLQNYNQSLFEHLTQYIQNATENDS